MITLFIIARDQWTWLQPMILWALGSPAIRKIWLVDNDSSNPLYLPLLAWAEENGVGVSRGENTGHLSPWHRNLIDPAVIDTPFYAVTDPDLELSTLPPDWATYFVSLLGEHPNVVKVGPALTLDGIPELHRQHAQDLELQFWSDMVSHPDRAEKIYRAPIDTTFYVSRTTDTLPGYGPALRVSGAYAVRHLPWFVTRDNLPKDFAYYLRGIDGGHCSGGSHYRKALGI